jgi:hypothetical protein
LGFLSGLLLFPVTGPIKGLQFIAEQLQAEADAIMLDEGRLQGDLMRLSLLREVGELSDADYQAAEAQILDRLNALRAYRDELFAAHNDAAYDVEDDGADAGA